MNIAPTSGNKSNLTSFLSSSTLMVTESLNSSDGLAINYTHSSEHLIIIRESFFTLDARKSSSMVKKYRPGTQSPSKTYVRSTDSDDGNLFDIPDSSPNSSTERPHSSDLLKTVNFKNLSPDPSGFHLNLADTNQDILTIPDSRLPSPIYNDTENMFNISDSPQRYPSPAPSELDSKLAVANRDIFTISDSRSPSPIYIDTEDMFMISDSPPRYPSSAPYRFYLNLAEANQGIFAIPDSRSPSPIYIETGDMFMISDSPPQHPSPAPSKRHSNLTEGNPDILAIQDSPSPSPKYIDTDDMFMISDSPPPPFKAKTTKLPTLAVSSVDNQPDESFLIQRIELS